jgi:type III restriction enzyme
MKVGEYLEILSDRLTSEKVQDHFGFIVAQSVDILNRYRIEQEEAVFRQHLSSGKLVLAASDDEESGYSIPKQDIVSVDRRPNAYNKNLFEDFESSALTPLERTIAVTLDEQEKLVWWFRHKVSRGWYAIQGWRKYKIHPNFVAAKKRTDGSLELVYVLESKGEHLAGNDDTMYKDKVMQEMTKTKIEAYQMEIKFGKVNDRAEFYVVEQGNEVTKVRTLFAGNGTPETSHHVKHYAKKRKSKRHRKGKK